MTHPAKKLDMVQSTCFDVSYEGYEFATPTILAAFAPYGRCLPAVVRAQIKNNGPQAAQPAAFFFGHRRWNDLWLFGFIEPYAQRGGENHRSVGLDNGESEL